MAEPYAPAYKDSQFQQGLTPGRPWVLVPGQGDHKRLGSIRFRDTETGETMLVPNLPYNQPDLWRAQVHTFYANEADASASRLVVGRYAQYLIDGALALAKRHRELAAEYQAKHDAGSYPREKEHG